MVQTYRAAVAMEEYSLRDRPSTLRYFTGVPSDVRR